MNNERRAQQRRPWALVTGASSGIGRDLALILAEHGNDLVLTARDERALDAVAQECASRFSVNTQVIPADLSDPSAPLRLSEQVRQIGAPIEFLVNNAGFGTQGPFARSDLARELALVQVNVSAVIALTRLLVGPMVERRSGRILNVASTAAFVAGPYMADYYASKAFVLSWSLALRKEWRGKGVGVTVLCPGPTQTDFQRRAGMDRARLFRIHTMDSLAVARAGYRGMMRDRAIVVPGVMNKLSVLGSRLLPRPALAAIAAKLNRQGKKEPGV